MWFRLNLWVTPPPVSLFTPPVTPTPVLQPSVSGSEKSCSFSSNKSKATPLNWVVQIGPYGALLGMQRDTVLAVKKRREERRPLWKPFYSLIWNKSFEALMQHFSYSQLYLHCWWGTMLWSTTILTSQNLKQFTGAWQSSFLKLNNFFMKSCRVSNMWSHRYTRTTCSIK